MAVKISGVLKDGTGKPVQNCTIQLKAKRNSTTVVVNTLASENPDEAGRYSMDVEYGQYSVILLVEGFPPSHAGTITVYEDSQPGTLNDFLGAMTEDDARPEALRRFELMVEEVARNASAVAQNTAEAAISASQAEEFASNASEYALNKFTFYKTPSDPDGTIAGLAATTSGQSFRVAEGPGATAAFKTYENQDGVAILQASQPGTAAITGTIREFPTLEAAQADADAGNILSGSKCWVTSAINTSLADEYVNTSGVMTATGRTIISQYSLSSSISREATRRKNGDYQDLIEFKSLDDTALPLPENSVLEFLSLATTTDVNTNFYRLVFSSLGSEVASLVFPGTNTQYSDGKFWSAYRLFRFQDLKYVSILETTSSVVRVRYDLPAGFGVPVAGSNYIALDITGKFYPAQAGSVNSVTRKSISGTAIANAIQFVVTIAELTAAGYTASTVVDYINSIAPDCLFAAYAAYDTTIAQTGFEDFFRIQLPAGDYTVSRDGFAPSGLAVLPAGAYSVWRKKPVRQVFVGNFLRNVADVKNLLSAEYKNYPVELKVSFGPGEVPDSDALKVMDADGNVFDCQFADNVYPNPRLKSNTGYHADGSLASGSVFITDTLASGQQKYYELRAYNRRRQDLASESFPQLVRVADGFTVTVGGYVYFFQRQNSLGLTSITDPAGQTHSFAHSCYCTGIVSGGSSSNKMVLGASLRMVNTGPVFTELELTVRNRTIGTLAEGALQSTVRYRIFKNGKVLIRVMTTATQDIPAGVLFGAYSRLNLNDGAYTFDAARALTYWTDSVTGKRFTATTVFANGDIHRDGPAYGPTRPIRATALQPTGTTTRLDAGWLFVDLNDDSFLNWPVPKNWTWTHETWIDCDNTITSSTSEVNALLVSQANNRPVGFMGDCSYAGVLRLDMLEKIACHVRGSVEWWKSTDATVYGGGPDVKTQFYCHMAEIFLLEKYGISTLNTVYTNFKSYMRGFGGITNPGIMFTDGWWGLQFQSRLSIPCYEWLYKMAVKAGDTAKQTELKAGIKSLADAVMVSYNTYGGVALVGTATNSGNSNSNATAMRVLALAIYMGLDTGGTYLAAFNALETFITNSATFMKAENIILDGPSDSTLKSMYLPYMVYATNNYLLACKLLNRTPKFDLVNFILTASNSAGGFSEVDYCISESRRGGANTIAFALLPLFQSARPSAMIAAKSLFGIFETQYGPKPGLPKRFFDFDGSSAAGSTMYDPCFVASTLADLWLSYGYN